MKTHLIPEPQMLERNDSRPQPRPTLGYASAGPESPRPSTQSDPGLNRRSYDRTLFERRLPETPMRNFLRVVFVR